MALKVLILNGPPRSGKDTFAKLLQVKNPNKFARLKFAYPLKTAVHNSLGLGIRNFVDIERYDAEKDEPVLDFFGRHPRKIYMEFWEKFLVPNFGREILGKVWLRIYEQMRLQYLDRCVVITDCGIQEELKPLLEHFAPGELMLIRLQRIGYDFTDYRRYVSIQDTPHKEYAYNILNVEETPEAMIEAFKNMLTHQQQRENPLRKVSLET